MNLIGPRGQTIWLHRLHRGAGAKKSEREKGRAGEKVMMISLFCFVLAYKADSSSMRLFRFWHIRGGRIFLWLQGFTKLWRLASWSVKTHQELLLDDDIKNCTASHVISHHPFRIGEMYNKWWWVCQCFSLIRAFKAWSICVTRLTRFISWHSGTLTHLVQNFSKKHKDRKWLCAFHLYF